MLNEKSYKDFVANYQAGAVAGRSISSRNRQQAPAQRRRPANKIAADRLLLQGRYRGTHVLPLVGSDDKAVAFQQRPGEGSSQFYMRYGDIPADRRKAVEDRLKANGLPSDKTAVENAYTAWRMAGNC